MDQIPFRTWLDTLDFKLETSEPFRRTLAGLPDAFDGERMKRLLSGLLFDPPDSATITACEAGKGNFQADLTCRVQYDLTIRAEASGEEFQALVNARLFPDPDSCRTFFHERLEPLARRMAHRTDILPFARPVGIIEPLNMTFSVFPIDGQLPALVDATGAGQQLATFNQILPDAIEGRFAIREIHQDFAHYGRSLRCVLRFRLEGEDLQTHQPQHITVYGKVDVDHQGRHTMEVVAAMQELLQAPGIPYCFSLPQTLGYLPACNMLLMTELPGELIIKKMNKQLEKGAPPVVRGTTLEEAIAMSAQVLATFHGLPISAGPRRAFPDEIASLQGDINVVSRLQPELGSQLQAWLDEIAQAGQRLPAMPLCFSDGDYTYTQLLFDGQKAGLVDFDTVCQAEPGLDLGQFLAYLRQAYEKGHGKGDPALVQKNEELCDLFLDTYLAAAGATASSAALLRKWVTVYELVSLLRLVLHSWQKFKGSRLRLALERFENQIERLEGG